MTVIISMTQEDTEWAYAGQLVGSTPPVSLKLKRTHPSGCAVRFKAWPLKIVA